jgi:hypothetical protein
VITVLRGLHHGRRAWIVGNGRSLLQTNPRELNQRGEITFAFNAIWRLPKFKPTYYCVEDRVVAQDQAADFNAYRADCKIIPADLSYCLEADVYVNFNRSRRGFPRFSRDAGRVVYWGGTVSYMAMQLAYYMGIRELYCIGMEGYAGIPDDAKREGAIITSTADNDPNHFDPAYFGKGRKWHDPCQDRMKEAHAEALSQFRRAGGEIYNCSPDEKWGVFYRRKWETVLA